MTVRKELAGDESEAEESELFTELGNAGELSRFRRPSARSFSPRVNAPRVNVPRANAPRVNAPRANAPRVNVPRPRPRPVPPRRHKYPFPISARRTYLYAPESPVASEYVRWVQTMLNQALNLQLPVDGVMSVETRSAIRSFQEKNGLPVTGIVGPDTERRLAASSDGQSTGTDGTPAPEPGTTATAGPSSATEPELSELEWASEINRSSSDYIKWVQQSLNQIMGLRLAVDGIVGAYTRSAIRSFQQQRGLTVDGIVGPNTEGALIQAGAGNPPGAAPAPYVPGGRPAAPAGRQVLSGASWVSRFPTSRSTSDLEPTFANNVNRFISALKAAGASVSIAATYRPQERAYLMHWAWNIANGAVSAQNVPPMSGVEINWWHGNDADSRRAAQEMVTAYVIRAEPSLTSRHIDRKAIDMSIYWSGNLQIKQANGQSVLISSSPKDGTNRSLIEVGRSYNVIHLQPPENDPPHWSVDGR